MHITRYTDYSLRVLLYVALKGEERSTISEIAERYDISRNHLMKVVQELNHKGYLQAIRGKHGGLLLKRRAQDINIGALVRDTEQDLALVECFGDNNQCVITPACRIKTVLFEALEAFFQVLDGYTLADMLEPEPCMRNELIKLLQLHGTPDPSKNVSS
ncbi:transcriptional regulator, BadM/Rrf2 family [Modicisalibacter ilicicola DSM 19980]|uniref:Transcriptional regulator, BadM/Rrf2 family n=1 Tax=Modicisalibacter ilicicola DSM 19980 TaxID=1121942 RepID=A0A1M4SQH9_9GAMM|nr:Rrf2 family transcriptional regulator [Halomonas ilicicola]SHE34439.1 transcriptional regulator, BadM/Rrf2 family [Halomonas ilicicola DSM 19980]